MCKFNLIKVGKQKEGQRHLSPWTRRLQYVHRNIKENSYQRYSQKMMWNGDMAKKNYYELWREKLNVGRKNLPIKDSAAALNKAPLETCSAKFSLATIS